MSAPRTSIPILIIMAITSCISCGANNSPANIPEPRTGAVTMLNGRPIFLINDEPVYPMIHALTDVPSGRWSWEELPQHNIRNFCNQGVRLFQLDVFLEHVFPSEETIDLTIPRKQIAGVLEVCPEASVIFRFHLRAPSWWMRAHPQEWVVYADTEYMEEQEYGLLRVIEHDNNPVRRVSMASRLWRDHVSELFIQFLNAFAETPESNALVGLQVANGVYGEWHNWGFFDNEPDISEPMQKAFVEWTRSKYKDTTTLQKAWNDPNATFESISCPDMEARATVGTFRDPKTQQRVIDYYKCMHEVVTGNIVHFSRLLKSHWPRPIVAGTFYGYYFSTFARQAAGGHLDLHTILEESSIDYLSGPQAYGPEAVELGNPYRSRSLTASLLLHKKLWLDEMDVEPTIPLLKYDSYAERLRDSVADVRRNTAYSYTRGAGLWYYDFNISGVDLDGYQHNMSGSQGNWDHPIIMDQIRQMRELFQRLATSRPYSSEADTLFVYDTESFYYTGSLKNSDPISNTLVDHNSLAAYRTGIVFDSIHVRDLPMVNWENYKVVVFNNTFVLNQEQRDFISDTVARDGRHLIWNYAPGWFGNDEGTGLEGVRSVTGFELELIPGKLAASIEFKDSNEEPQTYALSQEFVYPVLGVIDPSAELFGTFAGSSIGAIGKKSFPDHTSWFLSLPNQSAEPMKSLLRLAGAHQYSAQDAIFYGGGGILVLHSGFGGPLSIRLKSGKSVSFDLPKGPVTLLLDPDSGAPLLPDTPSSLPGIRVRYADQM